MKIKKCKPGMKVKRIENRKEKSSYKGDIEIIKNITNNNKHIEFENRSGVFNPKYFEPYNKIKTKILLEVETDFDDDMSNKETVKFCLEQDLRELKWQVNSAKIIDNN